MMEALHLRPGRGARPAVLFACLCALFSAAEPGSAGTPRVRFVEVTEEAGIDFRYVNGASGRKYMVEPMGSGAAFFDALRASASRFRGVLKGQGGRGATFNCPPMTPGAQEAVRTGAEPYWCYYISDDSLDLLVFRLQVIAGRGRVTYVGLFPTRPSGPIAVGRTDPSPPFVPPVLHDPNAPAAPPLPRRRPPVQPAG